MFTDAISVRAYIYCKFCSFNRMIIILFPISKTLFCTVLNECALMVFQYFLYHKVML